MPLDETTPMLGHSQITTTQVYTRVVPSDLQRVHKKTSPSERLKKIDVPTFKFNGMWHENTELGPRKGRRKKRVRRSRRAGRAQSP